MVTEPMYAAIAKQQGLEMPNREESPVPGPLMGLGLTGLMKASESSPTGSSTEEVLQELADVRKEPIRKPFFETQLAYTITTSLDENSKGIKSLEESMKGFQKSMDAQTEMLKEHLLCSDERAKRQETVMKDLASTVGHQTTVLEWLTLMLQDDQGLRSRRSSRRSSRRHRGHSLTSRNR